MVDSCLEETNSDDEENGDGDDADSGGTTEMRFAPADKAQLDYMYRAMSYCQALHPDPNDSPQSEEEDDDEEDEQYEDAEDEGEDLFAGGDGPYIEGHRKLINIVNNSIISVNSENVSSGDTIFYI
ncbi:hypothetical protein J6590_078041 [Homalodisca vitripennis]|nr:hypothetical protein J6590_078041 [Homalodisca vitripennis]